MPGSQDKDYNPYSDPNFGLENTKENKDANPYSDPNFGAEKPKLGLTGHLKDLGASTLSGVVGAAEDATVGLGNIYTEGRVGRDIDNTGIYKMGAAQEYYRDKRSDHAKNLEAERQSKEGILDKTAHVLQNPSQIAGAIAESLPYMAAGMGLGRMTKIANPIAAGAVGEGAIMAGAQAEDIRQQTDDQLLDNGQEAAAVGTGVLGALFGFAGGKIAQRLGIADVDTALQTGRIGAREVGEEVAKTRMRDIPYGVVKGAITEGFLEELPQSLSEQIIQNLALDKEWHDNLDEAAVMGTLSGMAMGGVMGGVSSTSDHMRAAREQEANRRIEQARQQSLNEQDQAWATEDEAAAAARASMFEQRAQEAQQDVWNREDQAAKGLYLEQPTEQMGNQGNLLGGPQAAQWEEVPEQAAARARSESNFVYDQPVYDDAGNLLNAPPTTNFNSNDPSSEGYGFGGPVQPNTPPSPQGNYLESATPSQRLGINPNDGPLSSAAALAVDSGVTPQLGYTPEQQAQNENTPISNAVPTDYRSLMDGKDDENFRSSILGNTQSGEQYSQNGGSIEQTGLTGDTITNAQGTSLDGAQTNGISTSGEAIASQRTFAPQQTGQDSQSGDIGEGGYASSEGIKTAPIGDNLQSNESSDSGLQTEHNIDSQGLTPQAQPILGRDGQNKWFASQDKASSFVEKQGLSENYQVVQTDKSKFEIQPKPQANQVANTTQAPTVTHDEQINTLKAQLGQETSVPKKAQIRKQIEQLEQSKAKVAEIETKANEAATGNNDLSAPTQAQIEAGNYKKGHIKIHGLDVAIENPRGSTRSGTDPDGNEWSHQMSDHYGYIKRTVGADQEQIDTYIGSNPESEQVFIVDQIDQQTGGFDEHKVMMGYDSQEQAIEAYKSNFDAGWQVGQVRTMSKGDFKGWLKNGDTAKPASEGWDGLSSEQKTEVLKKAGWVTQKGELNVIGKRLLTRNAKDISPSTLQTIEKNLPDANASLEQDLSNSTNDGDITTVTWKVPQGRKKRWDGSNGKIITDETISSNGSNDKTFFVFDSVQDYQSGNFSNKAGSLSEAKKLAQADTQQNSTTSTPKDTLKSERISTETVISPSGIELEVRHKLVELNELVTSHTSNQGVNPEYPQQLQPRDRGNRKASLDQVNEIVSKFDPRRLGHNNSSTLGAPIVSSDNVVESGNGRTLALKQIYETSPNKVKRYHDWLAQQGHDVSGFKQPVLVRERITPMTMAERVAYTKDSNKRETMDMSPTELAMSEAEQVMGILHLYAGGNLNSSANRAFVKAFLDDIATSNERAVLLDKDGMSLTQMGHKRINSALMAAAYNDELIVSEVVENADTDIKSIGDALLAVAPKWAEMRQGVQNGALNSDVDVTANLVEAVHLIRRARNEDKTLQELVNQDDIFAGAIDQVTKDFVSIFYSGKEYNKARSKQRVTDALNHYVTLSLNATANGDLLGDSISAQQILGQVHEQISKNETTQQQDLLSSPATNEPNINEVSQGGQGQRTTTTSAEQKNSKPILSIENTDSRKKYIGKDGAYVEVMENAQYAPRKNSIFAFFVPESARGQGIGKTLMKEVLSIYGKDNVSAAASSEASVKVFYDLGFRPTTNEVATLKESMDMMTSDSSVTMVYVEQKKPEVEVKTDISVMFSNKDAIATDIAKEIDRVTRLVKSARAKGKSRLSVHDREKVANKWGLNPIGWGDFDQVFGAAVMADVAAGFGENASFDELKNAALKKINELHGLSKPSQIKTEVAEKPKEKIQDFGEKLEGARKDTWSGYREKLNDRTNDPSKIKLAEYFPEPNYAKLIEDGVPEGTVAIIRQLRISIPKKPRSQWDLVVWVSQVNTARDMTTNLIDGKLPYDKLMVKVRESMPDFALLHDTMMHLGYPLMMELNGDYTIQKRRYSMFRDQETGEELRNVVRIAVMHERRDVGYYETNEQMFKDVKKYIEKQIKLRELEEQANQDVDKPKTKKPIKFELYQDLRTGKYFVGKKIGRNTLRLSAEFDTSREGYTYIREGYDKLVAELEKQKQVPDYRRATNNSRVGVDHRNGQDVTPELFSMTFGFRGVQFGNYVEGPKRQADLNNAYDSLMDLAILLNIPPRAVSLNGSLGLAFGARGKGGKGAAAAHYERSTVVINLTKNSGAGTLAHEWFHALDNYFSRERGESLGYLSDNPRALKGDKNLRPELVKAWDNLMTTIKQSDFVARSKKLDRTRSDPYWATDVELSARAFERYIIDRASARNEENDYLANIIPENFYEDPGKYPYPRAEEALIINGAYDQLFDTIQYEESENGTRLYSRAENEVEVGQSIDQVRDALVHRFGEKTIANLERKGLLEIRATHTRPGIEGWYQNGRVVLIADSLTPDSIVPTFLHELGGHAGFQNMMSDKQYAELMRQFDKLVAQKHPIAVEAKKLAEREKTLERQQLEYLPYLITLSSAMQQSNALQKGAIRQFIDRVVSHVKAWVFDKLGVNLNLSPNDMLALAERMVDKSNTNEGTNNQVLNSYLGEHAKQANQETLKKAKQMDQEGKSATTIRYNTGWFRGMDGMWRFEITDHETTLQNLDKLSLDKSINLSEILVHPALFENYPYFESIQVKLHPSDSSYRGVWDFQANEIGINENVLKNDPDYLHSLILHEMQHAIQSYEGFNAGGAPDPQWTSAIVEGLKRLRYNEQENADIMSRHFRHEQYEREQLQHELQQLTLWETSSKLKEYAQKDKPSSVLRHIRNNITVLHHINFENRDGRLPLTAEQNRELSDLHYAWADVGKRTQKGFNTRLSGYAWRAGSFIQSVMDPEYLQKFKESERSATSLRNSIYRKLDKVNRALDPLNKKRVAVSEFSQKVDKLIHASPGTVYLSLAGEIEARDTQERMNLTPEQRANRAPYSSQKDYTEKAIVINQRGGLKAMDGGDSKKSRIDMHFKDVVKRTPELQEAAQKIKDGEITHDEYAELVNKYKPVAEYKFVPDPATFVEMQNALHSNKVEKLGVPSSSLENGHPVGLRLDIPAYSDHGVWVVTVHEQKSGFGAGTPIGYESVAIANDVDFGVVEKAAVNIASGKPKATIATMKGHWENTTPENAKLEAEAAIKDPSWIQVGMDPERHAYFYNRATMQPVIKADRLIQIGPLVLAQNPVYDDTENYLFSRSTDLGQTISNIANAMRPTNLGNTAKYSFKDWLKVGLGALGRRQIVDIYNKLLPQLKKYSDLVALMDADKNDLAARADDVAMKWAKLPDERELAELMHEATLAKIDPSKPRDPNDNQLKYTQLRRAYDALTPGAKEMYKTARDMYSEHYKNVHHAIKERIARSALSSAKKTQLLKDMDNNFFGYTKGVYFPLARFGKYVVVGRDANGDTQVVSRAETMKEAQALRDQLRVDNPSLKFDPVILDKEFSPARDSVGRGFMSELFAEVGNLGLSAKDQADFEDTLSQLYLSSMPDLSWAKHGIHRKGMAGFSQDARRAFAQNMFHGGAYLAKLRYGDQLIEQLDEMQEHAKEAVKQDPNYDQPTAQRVIDEMNKRHESMMNPNSHPLSSVLTSVGFFFYMGLSPASAIVNLTQTALVAYPVMGSKWGYDKAFGAIWDASVQFKKTLKVKDANGKWTWNPDISSALNNDELKAYNEAVRRGVIDVTQAHDLAGIAQGEDSKVMWYMRPAMRIASGMFHHAERFNREVTFIAAYRLARDAGSDHDTALEEAAKATYDGHFDYSATNRPRFMQGNVAKVVLLFKQYAQNMVYTMVRYGHQSINGLDPAERTQARKALAGILGLHAATAGMLGLPIVGILATASVLMLKKSKLGSGAFAIAAAAALASGGDEDDPYEASVALRNWLSEIHPALGDAVMRGIPRALTPIDLSGRVGLNNLIVPNVREDLEGADWSKEMMAALLGPVAGIGTGIAKGAQEMGEGHYVRGLESIMPVVVRNAIKSYRYASDGVLTKNNEVIQDEVGPFSVAAQAIGFSPSDVRNSMEGRSAIYQYDKSLQNRRSGLMLQWSKAKMENDQERMNEIWEEIEKFNQENQNIRITRVNLMQSYKARQKRIDNAGDGGVFLSKKREGAEDQGAFAFQR